MEVSVLVKEQELQCILVIDDELGPRESLRILFKNEYEVVTVDSVDAGITELKEKHPDVVVMDIRMPDKSGLEGLKEIRAIDPDVPVIMLTGFGALETAQQALRLGATDYITKPFDTKEMETLIKRNISKGSVNKRRHRAVIDLENLNAQLMGELADKERLALVGKASAEFLHDIKNPLTIIVGYVNLLAESLQGAQEHLPEQFEETSEYIDIIEKSVARCHKLASMFKDGSPAEEVVNVNIRVQDILNDVIGVVQPLAALENLEIHYEHSADPSLEICAERAQILRVLHNLISNSIHAVESTPKKEIRVVCRSHEDQVQIEVADTGCGMEAEVLNKIFEDYYTTKDEGKGTGLGLPISRKIVETYKGSLHMESQPGQGTKATINLPVV